MKVKPTIPLNIVFFLFGLKIYAQLTNVQLMEKHFQKDFFQKERIGIEVKSKNPKYIKIRLFPSYLIKLDLKPEITNYVDAQSPNSGKYSYLYMALVEHVADGNGSKKEQVLLFFSDYNINAKQKNKYDTRTAYEKEIVEVIDNNPIVLAENQPEIFLEVDKYASSDPNIPKLKVLATTTYTFDINSLHPKKTPIIIGKKLEYKPNLESNTSYETTVYIGYDKNGNVAYTKEAIPKQGGKNLKFVEYIKTFDENGQVVSCEFGGSIKFDLQSNKTSCWIQMSIPSGLQKNWNSELNSFNTKIDLLTELRENLKYDPLEDPEQLKEFITNFNKLNEYIIIDENRKNVHGEPLKYVYKGTFNEKGIPQGWGLMYAYNQFEDQYFLGHFKNGVPDGFGFRNDFKLDNPETVYSSAGFHVGNTLIYGVKYTNVANGNGFNTSFGDFRQGALNGNGFIIWSQGNNGVGNISIGNFKDGNLHGKGSRFSLERKLIGDFQDGSFITGINITDKKYDNFFSPGVVVLYKGKKRVIMKKEGDRILLDNGEYISSKENLTLTGQHSVKSKTCLVCNGTGFHKPITNTVFSGVTKKTKTYETGPSGHIVWEKTTTTTTAPVTTSRTERCTSCNGGVVGTEPVPLNNQK